MSAHPGDPRHGTDTESWEDAASVAVKTASQTPVETLRFMIPLPVGCRGFENMLGRRPDRASGAKACVGPTGSRPAGTLAGSPGSRRWTRRRAAGMLGGAGRRASRRSMRKGENAQRWRRGAGAGRGGARDSVEDDASGWPRVVASGNAAFPMTALAVSTPRSPATG